MRFIDDMIRFKMLKKISIGKAKSGATADT